MTTQELLEKHEKRITRSIRYRAKRLSKMPVFATEDPNDFSQELWLRLIPMVKDYDPERGKFSTFVSTAIRNLANRITFDAIKAQKNHPEIVSLYDLVEDEGDDGVEIVERIETLADPKSEVRTTELRRDLQVTVSALPKDLQKLCALLMENPSRGLNSLARATKSTRRMVETRLQMIWEHFEGYGLREYLADVRQRVQQ